MSMNRSIARVTFVVILSTMCIYQLTVAAQAERVAPPAAGLNERRSHRGDDSELARPAGLPRGLGPLGYLVPHPAMFERAKGEADRRAAALSGLSASSIRSAASPATATSSTKPSASSWEGLKDATATPSDSTGAMGPNSYVEMVNLKIAVYSRNHTLLMSDTLSDLTASSVWPFGNPYLSDPQVIWDPDRGRFYYVILDVTVAEGFNDGIDFEFGFSRTDSPTSLTDWCNYEMNAGYDDGVSSTLLPDQPHIGDSQNFLFWGVNTFDVSLLPADQFQSADAVWISKPSAGSTCPADLTSFTQGKQADLRNADSSQTLTPVGVNQVDSALDGWLVGSEDPSIESANALTLFKFSDNGGSPTVQTPGTTVTVPSFGVPANAVQAGTSHRLDTMDGRLTQAVSANDPSHGNSLAIWTQHTVFGGAGAAVRWYEIDPSGPAIFQKGTISNSNLFVFNAAISPDRRNNKVDPPKFGNSMGIGFTTTSIYTDSTLWTASKVGTNPLSPWILVKQSPGPEIDQYCSVCRWGDYMGASPDPGADPLGAYGAVWMTSMWNAKSTNKNNFDWRTQNWRMGFVANSSSCTEIGTAGPDFLTGSGAPDVLCGKGGNDVLLGGAGNDTLLGGPGSDTLVPEGGNDTVNGGPGQDAVDYETIAKAVIVNLSTRLTTGQGTDHLVSIEHALGSPRSDTLRGSGASNSLYGLAGLDHLFGAGGNDYLNGGPGNDSLDGGSGTDRCVSGGGLDTKVSCEL